MAGPALCDVPLVPRRGTAAAGPLSSLEVSLLGVEAIAGGASGIMLIGPDGTTQCDLSLRLLLPDEVR